ncbi:MAG: glycoside hydrolase family 3 C-terminal domain-containing protein [Parafilimonas sp.]
MIRSIFFSIALFVSIQSHAQQNFLFRDTIQTIDARVNDLLHQLTLQEKISLLGYQSPVIARLNIPAYNWWNEALHGVARAGNATIFPQAIGMAASFNNDLLRQCANAISTEARAKYNLTPQSGNHFQYMGLTFWSPNINIFRDPRWGRGQETYGEDPFLTATMGAAFVQGIQGNDSLHLKAAACAKHYAVHSGPEKERHGFNAIVDDKDLRETYLYAFKKLVDAHVEAVMCAYNRVNGEPCCSSETLLHNILHKEWNFQRHVVTDCGALDDIYTSHKTYPTTVEVAAAAIKAGVDLECGNILQDDVMKAINQKLLTQQDIDTALHHTLKTEVKLGFFDDSSSSPYKTYLADSIANDYHRMLSRKLAEQSMVLLKNDNNILPLDIKKYPQLMIVGPNASSLDALLGNYHGVTDNAVNFVEGITHAVGVGARVEYDMGCDYKDTTKFGGIWAASNANITIACLGLTPVYEGEEGDAFLSEYGADRKTLSIPAAHIAYLKALRKGTKNPIILVINSGSAVDVSEVASYADAIILAWYPGEEGGNALADILFGKVSPSGHLPVTFYKSVEQLPAYNNYAMQGRTYRYFNGEVEFPFGFGMSYTKFDYIWNQQPIIKHDSITFSINIKNTGNYNGDEVAQVYVQYPNIPRMPLKELKAFKRVSLEINQQKTIQFSIALSELKKWNLDKNNWQLYKADYIINVGSNSADGRLTSTLKIK